MKKNRCAKSAPSFAYEKLEVRKLLAVDGFALIDGFGNNMQNSELGTVGEQFVRIAESDCEEGLSEPARLDELNTREISDILSAQEESVANDRFITSMWFQWGQFLDHDVNRVFDVTPEFTSETENLDISELFPFERSVYDPETGLTTPRQNTETNIDGGRGRDRVKVIPHNDRHDKRNDHRHRDRAFGNELER